jgi:hypothetical protein
VTSSSASHTRSRRIALLIIVFLSMLFALDGQPFTRSSAADSLRAADSTRVDTLRADSLSRTDSLDVDSLGAAILRDSLRYAADSVFYKVQGEQIDLRGNASIKYEKASIEADSIHVDMKKDQASSHGQTWLKDREYVLIGDDVYYDFDSQTGIIVQGATKFDKGFYYGKEIRKVDKQVYDFDQGDFTTCDALEPHFFIYSKKMRIYRDDKVVARPVVFLVNHFPVMALPYGSFSIKRGRKSGILMPEPGYNKVDGKYIQNLAYFQTFGPYADAALIFDYMEKTGWNARIESKYIQRYRYDGDFTARLQKLIQSADNAQYEWYYHARHHQSIGYASRFDADLVFLSSKRIWQSSTDTDERLSEKITSRVAYQNPLLGRTLYSNLTYNQDLLKDTRTLTAPSVSWSLPAKPLYEVIMSDSAATKLKDRDPWWKGFSYSYKFAGAHAGSITDPHPTLAQVLYESETDSTGKYLAEHHAGVKHNGSLTYSQTVSGWLNLSQSLTANEAWFDRDRENRKLQRGADWHAASTASFSLYGVRRLQGIVTGIRHIVTPRVSFNYKPSFRKNDRFYSFSGISLDAGKQNRNLQFGLDQTWQLKYLAGTEEHKLDNLLKSSSSVSYDLEKKKKRFGTIYNSLTLSPGDFNLPRASFGFNESFSASQNPYNFETGSWRISSSFELHGNADYTDYFPLPPNRFQSNRIFSEEDTVAAETRTTLDQIQSDRLRSEEWSLKISHDYAKTRGANTHTSNLRGTAALKVSSNWQVSYTDYFDLYNHSLVSQSINITRQMHCWRLNFSWSKSGDYWSYRFNFYDIKLPDALRFRTSNHKND